MPAYSTGVCGRTESRALAMVHECQPHQWHALLQQFSDASVYQTYAHDVVIWGHSHINHFVVQKEGRVVAAAQVRIAKAPGLNVGMAYVLRGPLWRPKGLEPDPEHFRHIIRGLRAEYVLKRGLLLRLVPNVLDDGTTDLGRILAEEGFSQAADTKRYRTFMMDLSPPLDELHKRMRYGWRRGFNKTLKLDFNFTTGTTDDLFAAFLSLYREMHDRKQFTQYVDVNKFRKIQSLLPQALKLHVTICRLNGQPVASTVCDISGKTALLVFLATSKTALQTYAAHAIIWEQMKWLKAQDIRSYDLGGIDPQANPGGYQFKSGPGGQDVYFLGQFEACVNPVSLHLIHSAQRIRADYRRCRERIRKTVHSLLQKKVPCLPDDPRTQIG